MKKVHSYQKGDPEWMIIQKQYHELLEEERASIAEWVSSEEEYAHMRQVLLELHDNEEEWLDPDVAIKSDLMKKFAAEDKGGRLIWLNTVLIAPTQSWLKKPLVRTTLAAACIVGLVVFFVLPKSDQNNQTLAEQSTSDHALAKGDSLMAANATHDTLKQFAELRPQEQLPPAPQVVQTETTESTQKTMAEDAPTMAGAWSDGNAELTAPASEDFAQYADQMAPEAVSVMEKKAETIQAKPSAAKAIAADKEHMPGYTTSVSASSLRGLLNELYTAR